MWSSWEEDNTELHDIYGLGNDIMLDKNIDQALLELHLTKINAFLKTDEGQQESLGLGIWTSNFTQYLSDKYGKVWQGLTPIPQLALARVEWIEYDPKGAFDPIWQHFLKSVNKSKGRSAVRCKHCLADISEARLERLKKHIIECKKATLATKKTVITAQEGNLSKKRKTQPSVSMYFQKMGGTEKEREEFFSSKQSPTISALFAEMPKHHSYWKSWLFNPCLHYNVQHSSSCNCQ